jgi:hypothetical protein
MAHYEAELKGWVHYIIPEEAGTSLERVELNLYRCFYKQYQYIHQVPAYALRDPHF